jgi:hypothetical protein
MEVPNVTANDPRWRCEVHAYVECRVRGGAWWLYAHPVLPADTAIPLLLVGAGVDDREEPLLALGVPGDVSLPVRDEYTWRVAGPHGGDAPNIVGVAEAERWISRGRSRPWPTTEPFARVTDPCWSYATSLDASDLATILTRYEQTRGVPAPAGYCALLATMRALERDYIVRLVLWLERRHAAADVATEIPVLREHPRDLERARSEVRPRRPRKTRHVASDS